MSKLSKVLSVLLAIVLLFSTASVGVEAAYEAYKDAAITRYDTIDKPVLTTKQYASMALDEVDRMLGERNLKIKYDVVGMFELDVDLSSVDNALDSIARNLQLVRGSTLEMIGGDIARINFSALVNMNNNPVTLTCPKRTTAGKSDIDIILSLLKFLKDNSDIIAKVPKGSKENGGLDLGDIVSGLVDLGDKLNVPKLVKELLGKFVYPDTPKAELPINKTLDEMVKDFIDAVASGDYANTKEGIGALKEASKLVKKYLPGVTEQIDLLNDSVYDVINKGVKIMLNAVGVPYANPRVKAALNRLCGYDYYKTTDEDGDTIWKRVEENPQDDLNAMINVINTDFNLEPFPVESWGDDWIFDHLNDILGQIVREAIKSDIAITWDYSRGNDALVDNIISVAKTVLSNTGDALFANYIEVLTPEEIENMDDEPFIAYVLRSILNASISFVYITHEDGENETVLEVLFELVKQIAADIVPWQDYSGLDADLEGIMQMGLDMAVYGLNTITNMDLEYDLDKDDFADAAMDWVIENYGGFVEDVQGNDGWEKLSYVIFNVIPSNWLSTNDDGTDRDNLYDILVYDIVDNILNFDLASVLKLVDQNPNGELNGTIIQVVLARLTSIINYAFPGVFPEADYSALENLLNPDLLSQIIKNLLDALYDRAQNGLLDALLPLLCTVLGLSSPESFGYPYISLEDTHTAAANALPSFYMYNGSSGINTNATDKYGNTPSTPDKLYTYRIKSVTTNNSSVRVSPTSGTINGGTSMTFTLSNVADAIDSVLKVTVTYDVLSEKGTVMTPNPLTATTYTYIHDPSIVEDDDDIKADADQRNMHLVYYTPTTYLSKGSKLSDLADYSMDLRRNKSSDSTVHNKDSSITMQNYTLDPGLAGLGVSVNPITAETKWQGGSNEYEPYAVDDATVEIPEGTYTNSFYFFADKTEQVTETISCMHNIFVYDDFGLRSMLNSAVNADRQRANYGTGSYEAEYVDFYADPEAEEPEMVTETVNGTSAWNRYVEAVDAAAAIVYAPKQIATIQTFVDNGDYETAAYELYCATKELDACSVSGGTANIKAAVESIVAPDTFINEFGEEETYDYDDTRRTYFGREDYISYTYSNFKSEWRAAQRVLDAEKAAIKKGEPYQIESIRAAYLAHRVNLYGERLVRVRAYTTYLEEAIEKFGDLYDAGQGEYSNKTWNDFTRAYNFANAVKAEPIGTTISGSENLANDGLRQTKVNEARAQLVKAAKRLAVAVPTVDMTQLNNLIATVKPTFQAGNDAPTYTELSWNTFVSAYREAVDIADDELELTDANQRKVNDKYDALDAAFKGLTPIQQEPEGNWSFTSDSEIFVSTSPLMENEFVTGLAMDYPWVTDYLDYSGSYTAEVEANEWGMESTGAILHVYEDGVSIGDYPIVLFGDINGDGTIDITDWGELMDAEGMSGLTDWEDLFFLTDEHPKAYAADMNHDGTLDVSDNGIMADVMGMTINYFQAWHDGEDAYENL